MSFHFLHVHLAKPHFHAVDLRDINFFKIYIPIPSRQGKFICNLNWQIDTTQQK